MTVGKKFSLALGFVFGILFFFVVASLVADDSSAQIIQKYKSGEIVCAEVGKELVCRSAK